MDNENWPTEDPDHPMHIHAPPISLYLGSTIGPIIVATALRVADWKLDVSTKTILTFVPLILQLTVLELKGYFPRPAITRPFLGRATIWLSIYAVTQWLCISYCSAERLLVVTFAVEVILPTIVIGSWEHSKADSSADQQVYGLNLVENFGVIYTLFSLLIVRLVVFIWFIKVVGALACYIVGLLLLGKLIKRHAYWTGFGSHFAKAIDVFNEVLTLYLVVEAWIYEEIPTSLQRRYSRRAQRKRASINVPAYVYQPLDAVDIRLLVLKQRSPMLPSVVEANMIHVSMDDVLKDGSDVRFEAMSYQWGSAEKVDTILIDGKEFWVTQSAFNVIMARRSSFQERVIWIDAICINQSDQEEKSRQIAMMQLIYYEAHRVIAVPTIGWQSRLAAKTLMELRVASQISWIDINDLVLSTRGSELRWST